VLPVSPFSLSPCSRMATSPTQSARASSEEDSPTNDHTIGSESWKRYKQHGVRFKVWATTNAPSIKTVPATVAGNATDIVWLLDSDGNPLVSVIERFLGWYSNQDTLQHRGVHNAKSYLTACIQIARHQGGLPLLDRGCLNSTMILKLIEKESTHAQGMAKTLGCLDTSTRADHVPTHDEIVRCMRVCLAADARLHPNPLVCIQTAFELRVMCMSGVRGQVVRTATFKHVWTREADRLANGHGLTTTVMHNTREGKTNVEGDGTHSGWMSARDPLLCPNNALGLCMLYRFLVRQEPFPNVLADNGGSAPGHQYKWLPLSIAAERMYDVDYANGQLAYHSVTADSQNDYFNMLFGIAKLDMVTGDAVTHMGRHIAQQEFLRDGGDQNVCNEAIGYSIAGTSESFYSPFIPIVFQLQRALFGLLTPQTLRDADAAHLRVLREYVELVNELINLVLPELVEQERLVDALAPPSPDASVSRKEARTSFKDAKKVRKETHERPHRNFLEFMRHILGVTIVSAAARTRHADGTVDTDAQTLLQEFGSSPIYSALRIRSTQKRLFDHPKFADIAALVRAEEIAEATAIRPSLQVQADATAAHPRFDRIEQGVDRMEASSARIEQGVGRISAMASSSASEVRRLQDVLIDNDIHVPQIPTRVNTFFCKDRDAVAVAQNRLSKYRIDMGLTPGDVYDTQTGTFRPYDAPPPLPSLEQVLSSPPPPPPPPAPEAPEDEAPAPPPAPPPPPTLIGARVHGTDVHMIWNEYSLPGGLGIWERDTNGGWRADWMESEQNLFRQKQVVCRAIARYAQPPSTIETALELVQTHMMQHGTFTNYVKALQRLEKDDLKSKEFGKRVLACMF